MDLAPAAPSCPPARVREVGVRRALGATTSHVLRLVAGSGVGMNATGAVIGLALSTASARLPASMLFGLQPLDPVTDGSVTVVLARTSSVWIVGRASLAFLGDPWVALS